jgi:pimeloyl-ACP methyl ester carboxylesterase
VQQGENVIPLYHEIHPCEDSGAPWILFIHGAGGSTRTWRKQIDTFKEKFNLLLIDLPGHAQSKEATLHQPFYNFEWIANKIWEVVDIRGIKKIHIAAVSLGSIIAMQMKHNRPQQVAGMVFAGPIVALNTKLRILAKTGLALARLIGYQNFYSVTAK